MSEKSGFRWWPPQDRESLNVPARQASQAIDRLPPSIEQTVVLSKARNKPLTTLELATKARPVAHSQESVWVKASAWRPLLIRPSTREAWETPGLEVPKAIWRVPVRTSQPAKEPTKHECP